MRAWHWMVGLVVAMAIGYVFWYRYLHVKVRSSTEAGIRAVVPAELLPPATPPDLAARGRFDRLYALDQSIKAEEERDSEEDDMPAAKVTRAVQEALDIARQGPIEWDPAHANDAEGLWSIVRGSEHEARFLGNRGDSAGSEKLLEEALSMSLSVMRGNNGFMDYLAGAANNDELVRTAANLIRKGRLRPSELRRLVHGIPKFGPVDEDLQLAYRHDLEFVLFRQDGGLIATAIAELKGEGTNNVNPDTPGNFDVLATARLLAALYGEWIANAGRPWDRQDGSVDLLIEKQASKLPNDESALDPTPSKQELLKYNMQLNAIPNSNGIEFVKDMPSENRNARKGSIEMACEHELLRLLAAVWAYKEEHQGAFPRALSALVTGGYLREIPIDPFSGKPLLYNAGTHVIYSVGPNRKDNGGAFLHNDDDDRDLGFYPQPSK